VPKGQGAAEEILELPLPPDIVGHVNGLPVALERGVVRVRPSGLEPLLVGTALGALVGIRPPVRGGSMPLADWVKLD
jgi:hypothetical protein